MDDPDSPSSPRKRLKIDPSLLDLTVNSHSHAPAPPNTANRSPPATQVHEPHLQVNLSLDEDIKMSDEIVDSSASAPQLGNDWGDTKDAGLSMTELNATFDKRSTLSLNMDSKTSEATAEGAKPAQPTNASHDMQLHKEAEVGITEFVNLELKGYHGLFKKRYTDFLVNEILLSGQVVHLTNLKAPKGSNKTASTQTLCKPSVTAEKIPSSSPTITKTVGDASESSKEATTTLEHAAGQAVPATKNQNVISVTGPLDKSEDVTIAVEKITELASSVPLPDDGVTKDVDVEEPAKEKAILGGAPENKEASTAGPIAIKESKMERYDPKNPPKPTATIALWQSLAAKQTKYGLKPADEASLNSFFDPDVVRQILALFEFVTSSPHRKPEEYGLVTSTAITDRQLRTNIHQELRRIFSGRLETYTQDDGAMVISVASSGGRANGNNWIGNSGPFGQVSTGGRYISNRQPQYKQKLDWKDLGGEFLHFSLYKENKDTMEVVSFIASQLKMKASNFQFAGTKDRRGVTVQRVSVFHIAAERMVSVGRSLRNAKIGNYKYESQSLELGQLKGNEFHIALRDCHFGDSEDQDIKVRLTNASEIVGAAVNGLVERGFLNYYGLQRFGTFTTSSDTIGMKMLQGDFKGAVDAILQFTSTSLAVNEDSSAKYDRVGSDDKARARAIDSFRSTGRSYPALEILPRKLTAEASIIRYLGVSRQANDYLGALNTINRNLRLIYVHSYQSVIWNLALSHRWSQFGPVVLEGDLVLVDEHKAKTVVQSEAETIDTDGEVIVHAAASDSATRYEDRFQRARALTSDEASSGSYTIYDIVLPTPGYDILYPAYMVSFYETTMAREQYGCLNPHDMRRGQKDISLSGSYRKILAKPEKDFRFEVRPYMDENEQFLETDLDRMIKKDPKDKDLQANETYYGREQQGGSRGQQSGRAGQQRGNSHQHGRGGQQQGGSRRGQPQQRSGHRTNGQGICLKDNDTNPLSAQDVRHEDWNREQAAKEYADLVREAEEADAADLAAEKAAATQAEVAANAPQKIAVILKLQLGSSQYATMALRELMKLGGVQTYKPDFGGGR